MVWFMPCKTTQVEEAIGLLRKEVMTFTGPPNRIRMDEALHSP